MSSSDPTRGATRWVSGSGGSGGEGVGGATRGSVRVRNVRLNTSRRPRDVLTNGVGSGFGKWMQETHDGAFTSAFKRVRTGSGGANANGGNAGAGSSYDHVYIDVNNVLHVAAHHTKHEEAFFKKLFALLDLNMRRTKPRFTVVLALDGPAPIAKTITQRRRRIRLSSGEKVPLSEDKARLLKIGLTPGSALALKIDRALEYYAATRLTSRNALPKGLLFEISGTRVPGEGEVKILRSMKSRVKNPKFANHSHLIVSEDSDALLLAMTAAPADVFVLSSKLVFSVKDFNASLAKDFPPSMSPIAMAGARRDFVALAVMMGNDYLPGSRFGVKFSWEAYVALRRSAQTAPDWKTESEKGRRREGKRGIGSELGGGSRRRGNNNNGNGGDVWDDGNGGDAGDTSEHTSAVSVETVNYTEHVCWGAYSDLPLFPAPGESDFGGFTKRAFRFFGADDASSATCATYEDGKLAFRHPPPVNWVMLRDFANVLSDPEYVKWQVAGGLRPRADVQRAVNAAAASVNADEAAARTFDDDDAFQDSRETRSASAVNGNDDTSDGNDGNVHGDTNNAHDTPREAAGFSTIPGVAGVVRARLDPKRSARRAYEYVHGVGWVLEMYYSGACLDYGYHFQYSAKEHNEGIAATIGRNGDLERGNAGGALARAADDAATAAATATTEKTGGGAGASVPKPPHMGGRSSHPPPAVDLADFRNLPVTYDPTLDPLRDRQRASLAYLNRYPITPLAYSLAVIPRGGRAMLAKGVRSLVDAGSPVHHLFCDDYCVTCIKHRINAGPLERVIQREAGGGNSAVGGAGGRGGGGRGGRGRGRGEPMVTGAGRDLSRKIAGGDATIREAAEAGGDLAREVLRKLNRKHLDHLSTAPQHATDKPPPPLNFLEGAVARLALDDGLTADEETLRTLGDEPVLIWHGKNNDPPDLGFDFDEASMTQQEDIPRWAALVAPPGCRPVGRQMHEIRRYDGDATPVIAAWAVGGEAPSSASGPGGGLQRRTMPKDTGGGGGGGGQKKVAQTDTEQRGGDGTAFSGGGGDEAVSIGGNGSGAAKKKQAARSRAAPKPPNREKPKPKPKPASDIRDTTATGATRGSRGGRVDAFPVVGGRKTGMSAQHAKFASGANAKRKLPSVSVRAIALGRFALCF